MYFRLTKIIVVLPCLKPQIDSSNVNLDCMLELAQQYYQAQSEEQSQ
jgi:hypothetical protein